MRRSTKQRANFYHLSRKWSSEWPRATHVAELGPSGWRNDGGRTRYRERLDWHLDAGGCRSRDGDAQDGGHDCPRTVARRNLSRRPPVRTPVAHGPTGTPEGPPPVRTQVSAVLGMPPKVFTQVHPKPLCTQLTSQYRAVQTVPGSDPGPHCWGSS